MGTSGTESCEGCLWTQFKHLPPQLALKLSIARLQSFQTSKEVYELRTLQTKKLRTLQTRMEKIAQNAVFESGIFSAEPVA